MCVACLTLSVFDGKGEKKGHSAKIFCIWSSLWMSWAGKQINFTRRWAKQEHESHLKLQAKPACPLRQKCLQLLYYVLPQLHTLQGSCAVYSWREGMAPPALLRIQQLPQESLPWETTRWRANQQGSWQLKRGLKKLSRAIEQEHVMGLLSVSRNILTF